jgi:6-phosphogluconolactonase
MIPYEHYFSIDSRRFLVVPGHKEKTIEFSAEHFVSCAKEALDEKGKFFVALSGGSTPKAIFEYLKAHHQKAIDWKHVYAFFSDERAVPPTDPESNYHMAITHGLADLGISHIYRMQAENNIAEHAQNYENLIKKMIPHESFDLMMLGMGDDGHTASLFPHTDGVKVLTRLVIANHVPQKNCDRMTMTFPLINKAKHIVIYVLGSSKKEMVQKVLVKEFCHDDFPATKVGSEGNPATWILDHDAAAALSF